MKLQNRNLFRGEIAAPATAAGRQADRDILVFPALMSVYRDQGYEIGYVRGQNDVLASLLEAIEDYVRDNTPTLDNPRQLLYGFGEFLEQRLGQEAKSHYVSDGLGI